MLLNYKHSFNEFIESEEGIATNIITNRLALLEKEEIVKKSEHPRNKSKGYYILTEKGINLIPMLIEMMLWSAQYDVQSQLSKEQIVEIQKDKKI